MTAKKSKAASTKTPAKKRRPAVGMVNPPIWPGKKSCTNEEICEYLTQLGKWLNWFNNDYKRLRKAVCNVEKKAWVLPGSTTAKRFCSHGVSDEPADPVKPPVWT